MNSLNFKNINEITFKKVGEDTFSITIKSDIEMNNKNLENTTFEAGICKLDSRLELHFTSLYTNVKTNFGILHSEYYNIPINVQILLDKELNKLFEIRQDNTTK